MKEKTRKKLITYLPLIISQIFDNLNKIPYKKKKRFRIYYTTPKTQNDFSLLNIMN